MRFSLLATSSLPESSELVSEGTLSSLSFCVGLSRPAFVLSAKGKSVFVPESDSTVTVVGEATLLRFVEGFITKSPEPKRELPFKVFIFQSGH